MGALVSAPYRSMFHFPLLISRQISDEHSMPADAHDGRMGESERDLGWEDAALASNDGDVKTVATRNAEALVAALRSGTPAELEAAVVRLRQLHHRIGQRQLEPDDWPLLRLLLREAMDLESSDAAVTSLSDGASS